VGGLSHYLEEEGLSTTSISLVREHTVKIKPPRALWVPFPLGRPLGVPGDPAFQRKVLLSVLALLDEPKGPVLKDFPEDAPGQQSYGEAEQEGYACPVPIQRPAANNGGQEQDLNAALIEEIEQLEPWYDLSVQRRKRTTVGASGLAIRETGQYVARFLHEIPKESPKPGLTVGELLKLACEDLRAYYFEAAAARPGQNTPHQISEWFWNGTVAGKVFRALRPICRDSDDQMMRAMGLYILVPRNQMKGVGENPEYHS
jgi:hypothetical protein